jgi:hypothetical protein
MLKSVAAAVGQMLSKVKKVERMAARFYPDSEKSNSPKSLTLSASTAIFSIQRNDFF